MSNPIKETAANKALRPITEDEADALECDLCMLKMKIDAAMSAVHMFLDATKPTFVRQAEDEEPMMGQRKLSPKEEACYLAALHRLETYIDSDDF